jgi:two-component system cell cycle sensor histidine kinase/response regulator CckA
LTIGTQWKQTRGLCPVEGERERVNESSHHPRSSDAALLSSILDLAPLSVIAWDGAGRIVLWNAEAERLLGWRAPEVLGKTAPFPTREATPAGGRLTLRTGMGRLERDPTGGDVPIVAGEYGWLTVEDSGRGIPRDMHGRIFEPFYTTKERGTGTGLGLSAVYGIVKQSGGYIFLRSLPDQGAAFTIYLPVVAEVVEASRVVRAEHSASDEAPTILLVEDEAALRGLMRRLLERSGYNVLEAEHGAHALTQCKQHEGAIDLVVSDIVMPTMGGREMALQLRDLRPNSRLLFVSGFSDDEKTRGGSVITGSEYLQKPFSPSTLIAKIEEMLHARPTTPP